MSAATKGKDGGGRGNDDSLHYRRFPPTAG